MHIKLFRIMSCLALASVLCIGCGRKDNDNVSNTATEGDMISSPSDSATQTDPLEPVIDFGADAVKNITGYYIADSIVVDGNEYSVTDYFETEKASLSITVFSNGRITQTLESASEKREYSGNYYQNEDGSYGVIYQMNTANAQEDNKVERDNEYFIPDDGNGLSYYIEGAMVNYVCVDDGSDAAAIEGEYYMSGMVLDTKFYSLEELEELGVLVEGYLTVKSDGEFELAITSDKEAKPKNGNWSVLGANLYSFESVGKQMIVTYDGAEIEMEISGNASYVFDKVRNIKDE